ncbi:MAG TPA: phage tail assembly chaperone [Brevundimonas sp.]|uniref:phage tail assembly chaperone n=1 Tax=Brevundimonas sp. TaxID=1871086 RepID=UPI002ED7F2D6
MTKDASPWGAMIRTAALLGITPAAFWRLSLAEWRMLTEDARVNAPISRAALTGMTEMWPDD